VLEETGAAPTTELAVVVVVVGERGEVSGGGKKEDIEEGKFRFEDWFVEAVALVDEGDVGG
jgi:hypothetical protein